MHNLKPILPLLLIFFLSNCYVNARNDVILKRDIPVTLVAEKDETFFITTEKYPGITYDLTIKDFDFLVKQGTGFVKGGNKTNHDLVITTIKAGNNILWDLNDTKGINISIYDNVIYDIQFKSLYLIEGNYLVFNLTEIDTATEPYTSSVEYNPINGVIRFLGIFIFICLIILSFYKILFKKRSEYAKQKARLPKMQR